MQVFVSQNYFLLPPTLPRSELNRDNSFADILLLLLLPNCKLVADSMDFGYRIESHYLQFFRCSGYCKTSYLSQFLDICSVTKGFWGCWDTFSFIVIIKPIAVSVAMVVDFTGLKLMDYSLDIVINYLSASSVYSLFYFLIIDIVSSVHFF